MITAEPRADLLVVKTDETCSNCKFWIADCSDLDYGGECHRRCPIVLPPASIAGKEYIGWPDTKKDDWCGEWEYRAIGP